MARIVLLLLVVAIASASIADEECSVDTLPPNCKQYRLSFGVPCQENYTPVCGTDGITYKNECKMCLKRMYAGLNIQIAYMGEC
ncbi:trypsin inhibitor ClTI-1-like [Misgurnus anguillicaudatus]|uniref:trypsin inhibitor ClTI-1-like n=1 Tax=Misgurnus anguillicaudatus TaxID=75329 RepID=UPI003CCF5C3B